MNKDGWGSWLNFEFLLIIILNFYISPVFVRWLEDCLILYSSFSILKNTRLLWGREAKGDLGFPRQELLRQNTKPGSMYSEICFLVRYIPIYFYNLVRYILIYFTWFCISYIFLLVWKFWHIFPVPIYETGPKLSEAHSS